MISKELKSIIETLKNQGKMCKFDGVTDDQLRAFEANHSTILPSKYKEWLQFSDGGECFLPAGIQFYGIVHKPTLNLDDDDRPDDSYIVIGRLASGDPILFQKGNEHIFIYDHEFGVIHEDETYSDFFAFLNDLYDLLGIGE